MSCSYLLCTILLFVAVLLAVTVTGTILFMNHYQAPPMSDGLPHISTNQDEANALVTVERGDGSRINIFIDPNCPDYNSNFLRLEGVQTSLLHSLTDHDSDLKSVKGQDRALLVSLAEEVAKLSAHAEQLKMDYEALRRGQGSLGQDLNTLQTEQGRLIQVRNPLAGMGFMHTGSHVHALKYRLSAVVAALLAEMKCIMGNIAVSSPHMSYEYLKKQAARLHFQENWCLLDGLETWNWINVVLDDVSQEHENKRPKKHNYWGTELPGGNRALNLLQLYIIKCQQFFTT